LPSYEKTEVLERIQ